jgi:glycosyltransferase involved in cell wall biosynthesis
MPDVTAILAVLNEADSIRGCLETLDWCDNIVVVDNGSDDDTVDIAQEYTERIIHYNKQHGFGDPLKRHGIKQVKTEWAFIIDADELVQPRLADRLKSIVDRNNVDVVEIPFKNYLFGQWVQATNWWPAFYPRLFRVDSMNLTEEVHAYENVDDDATVHRLPLDPDLAMIHFNYTDIEDYISRTNTYTTIEADQKNEHFSRLDILRRPIEEFGYQLLKEKGYKIGRLGLLIALLTAWYRFLMYLKMWERQSLGTQAEHQRRYDEIRKDVINDWNNE